ncbi:probable L-type lectin-domain containing receptor kinase S.5 [Andrographis paniculata]|uniref:probable L-type lectin-domain containing receptor kinase S.5 n=1 Tax=Andrographis paniculata TaxID=175694 RepID=UPI0021E9061E|nr:probable L-type lectin-domain containing receptor kinase S.5 [Andrographis paniculata]
MAKLVAAAAIAVAVSFLACSAAAKPETFRQEYGPFNETHYDIFEVERPATISNDALQITPDSINGDLINLYNNSGRVLLKQRFKLWEGAAIGSGNATAAGGGARLIASFNTSFLVNIYRPKNETAGEGLAFVIAPDLELPANSSGQFLGLTNSSTDGDPSNRLVAVELDTFKQSPFDPDDNHIGIDINGVRSVKTAPLAPHRITLAPIGARFYNVWVDYDGAGKALDVYIAEQATKEGPTPPKPESPILSEELNLIGTVSQYSYFGFSAATGDTMQLNCILRWNLTVHHFGEEKSKWLTVLLSAGIPLLVVVVMAAAAVAYYVHRRRVAQSNPSMIQALKSLPGTPREFEFRDLKKGTNSFDEEHKLGQGGYGVVYRGRLVKENMEIAVKCFSRESIKGQDDFLAELTIINRLRHKHLVKLLGWCHKNGKLLLVYEYMPNGSLDKHLFVGAETPPLRWSIRHQIISGVAAALHYLHNEFEQRVVHRDLKASNIMLDSNFNARLGDFGLARALDNEKTSYAEADGVLGTLGYIAPECFHTGKATQQSDIYAFGAVLLELVCGQRPGARIAGFQFLVDWVWYLRRDGRLLEAVDKRLGDGDYVPEEAERLLLLGLACSHPAASERPRTQAILQMISGTVAVPVVPPFKPAFVWPAIGGPVDLETTGNSNTTTSHFGSVWSPLYLTGNTTDDSMSMV